MPLIYFSFRFFRSEQRTYGHSLSNGTWTGIIGQLQKQKVDFAGTLFTVSRERYGVIDFSEHIYLDEMTAAYVRPGVVPNMAGFVQPYTFLVWLLVLVTTLMVFGTLLAVQLRFLHGTR
ncbi:hypothetical protein O3P69_009176 [Scylla paramamosain]|uniref:Ionotropic glutamate receptor L-glutamate and glycine-binding domain-containing protein n=1 Tax=Scylla paramamosain TaxID=85552 RepID=A0AAW0T9T4_SCYPA